jgi:hypothetical protein
MVYHVPLHRLDGTVDCMVLLLWLQRWVEVEMVMILVQWVSTFVMAWRGLLCWSDCHFQTHLTAKSHVEDMDDMVGRERTLAMKRMIVKMLTERAQKKVCAVQNALEKNDETYVSSERFTANQTRIPRCSRCLLDAGIH